MVWVAEDRVVLGWRAGQWCQSVWRDLRLQRQLAWRRDPRTCSLLEFAGFLAHKCHLTRDDTVLLRHHDWSPSEEERCDRYGRLKRVVHGTTYTDLKKLRRLAWIIFIELTLLLEWLGLGLSLRCV